MVITKTVSWFPEDNLSLCYINLSNYGDIIIYKYGCDLGITTHNEIINGCRIELLVNWRFGNVYVNGKNVYGGGTKIRLPGERWSLFGFNLPRELEKKTIHINKPSNRRATWRPALPDWW